MRMKKRLCFVVTDALSFNVLMKGQLEYLKKQSSVDVTLVCGGSPQDFASLEKRNVGRTCYIPFKRKPHAVKDLICLLRLIVFFRKEKFDVIVYSTPKAMLLASIATYLSNQPMRVALFRGRVYEGFRGMKKKCFIYLDKLAVHLSNRCCAISHSLKSNLSNDLGIDRNKIDIVGNGSSNGVDIDYFKPLSPTQRQNLRENLNFTTSDFIVVVVGRLCKDKGIKRVEEIISRLNEENIKFLVVGRVEDSAGKDFIGFASMRDNVEVKEHMSEVAEVYQIADVHLFLTEREGFGNVAVEAAATGIPTLAYRTSGTVDSVKDGVSGKLFMLGEVESIVEELRKRYQATRDNGRRVTGESDSREWVIRNFESEMVWNKYLEYFLSCSDPHWTRVID